MTGPSSASQRIVRDVVAAGDHRRRRVDAIQRIARLAPMAAAAVLAIAVAGRLAGWSALVPLVALVAGAGAVVVAGLWPSRRIPPADLRASRLDDDAQLHGELRSAHWFADLAEPDVWSGFHIDTAAGRASGVMWRDVYPPVRATRRWVASVGMAVIAVALALSVPGLRTRIFTAADAMAGPPVELSAELLASLPPGLPPALVNALATLANANLSAADTQAIADELLDGAELDPKAREQIEKMLAEGKFNKSDSKKDEKASKAKEDVAEPADEEAAPEMDAEVPEELQWARDDAAAKQASQKAQAGVPASQSGKATTKLSESKGELGEAQSGQVKMDTQQAGDASRLSLNADTNSKGTTPGEGFAGSGKTPDMGARNAQARQLAAALKQELIRADENSDGAYVKTDDRHRTEQRRSDIAFNRGSPLSDYARARADMAAPVPEARRPLLERYFVRDAAPN